MKLAIMIFAVVVLAINPSLASGKCKVEAWRAYAAGASMLFIEGATTCAKGEIVIRLYDGSGESAKFIGLADGYIEGNAFKVIASRINKPSVLTIKYNIKE